MPKYAIAQMEPIVMDPRNNLRKMAEMAASAADQDAEIVVFPELALTGCCLSEEQALELAEPIPGPSTEEVVSICARNNVLIVVGMIEGGSPDGIYNSAILAGPDGILGKYRKTHLPLLGVDKYLDAGDELFTPLNTSIGRLGMLICWDIFFPENARSLALAGAQVILTPTAWLASNDPALEFYRIRAIENGVHVIWANRVGEEAGLKFMGRSGVATPDGEVVIRGDTDKEEVLVVEIDLNKTHRGEISSEYEMDILRERRPELYSKLVE